jgi:DeoR family transcriptional regulator, aga operon transcriptional repressor
MKGKRTKRSTVERRKKILNMLETHGQVFVHELSEDFGVSEVTIRNDLEMFESKGLLIRSRGGAMIVQNTVGMDFRLSDKDKMNYSEKIRIGKKAAQLVNSGETIVLDSGTTTMEIAKNLNTNKAINVITNALNIANELIKYPDINIIVPGGTLRKNSHSLVGPLAEKSMRNFYVDKVFLGVDGFDTTEGAFTPNIEEASLNQIMIEITKEVIVVADSSKFKRRSLAFICPPKKIDIVITDDKISQDDKNWLIDQNIQLIIA